MTRFGRTSKDEVARLATRLDITFSESELAGTVDRLEALADIYEELDEAPVDRLAAQSTGCDVFEEELHSRGTAADPHNAWVSRFELTRPDAGRELSDLTVAIKDNTCVRGVELTCGSRAFTGVVPDEHAPVVDRLLDSGVRILGKTNLDELTFGPTSETSAFGPTENPTAPGCVAGGSSSGSAAAVAAGDVDLALGTDTGGSVRIPASYCGIVGMKPTYDAVPLRGIVPLAPSMDHVGTLARDVETATRGLAAIADSRPDGSPRVAPEALGTDLDTLTIGHAPGFFEKHTSEAVASAVMDALAELADAGADVRQVDIPALAYSRQAWWGIAPSEFAAAFASNGMGLWRRGRSVRSLVAAVARVRRASSRQFGTNVKEMFALGEYLNTVQDGYFYARARNLRAALTEDFDDALADVDVLAAPGTPTTAPEIGGFERGVTPPVNWVTHPTNLTGHPSVSVPCGEVDDHPVGLQFMGPTDGDQAVLDAAYAYEQLRRE